MVAIPTPEWKCIWVPDDPTIGTELYDLRTDPFEMKNLFAERPEMALELQAHLPLPPSDGGLGGHDPGMSPEEQAMLEKRLRELGYI